jgi:U-box domain
MDISGDQRSAIPFPAKARSMMHNVPTKFLCPITMEIMNYPMLSRHGHNFERSAIVAWLKEGSGVCPMTRLPLEMSDLIHNSTLSNAIEQWRQVNGMSIGRPFDEMQSDGSDIMRRMYGAAIPYHLPLNSGKASSPPTTSANPAGSAPTSTPRSARSKLWTLVSRSRRQRLSPPQ